MEKVNYNQITGFNQLSEKAKELLIETNKRHRAGVGTNYKDKYIPVKVEEHNKKLKVYFKDTWLHYYPNGTWG